MVMQNGFYVISIKINSTCDLEKYHQLLTEIKGPLFLKNNGKWYDGQDVLAINNCDFTHRLQLFCQHDDALKFKKLEYRKVS